MPHNNTPTKYLYAASVEAKQKFIFQSDKLKDIVGASQIIEEICTKDFARKLGYKVDDNTKGESELKRFLEDDPNLNMAASGEIKYIFPGEEEDNTKYNTFLEIVKTFPKEVAEKAPGIIFTQAVIELKDGAIGENTIPEIESLFTAQRNVAPPTQHTGLLATVRSRQTGMPAIKWEDDTGDNKAPVDCATINKREASNSANKTISNKIFDCEGFKVWDSTVIGTKRIKMNDVKREQLFTLELDKIIDKNTNEKIAILHCDGNSLTNVIKLLVRKKNNQETKEIDWFPKFSKGLNKATIEAVSRAIYALKNKLIMNDIFAFRPIALAGDDITIIMNAKWAIEFAHEFLTQFKQTTHHHLKGVDPEIFKHGLTACGGICITNSHFPFHYSVDMAEQLCAAAKKRSKEIMKEVKDKIVEKKTNDAKKKNPEIQKSELDKIKKEAQKELENKYVQVPSSMAFHVVNETYTDSLSDIIKKDLTIENSDIVLSLFNGPYFTAEEFLSEPKKDVDAKEEEHQSTGSQNDEIQNELYDIVRNEPQIQALNNKIELMLKKEVPKSKFRNWLSECRISFDSADIKMKRIFQILKEKGLEDKSEDLKFIIKEAADKQGPDENGEKNIFTDLHDVIQLTKIVEKVE